ncbi:MAG: pur operon repressor [Eubacteriales bacterium]|nr:pur operon repressor [Eubacteriales bacterium]MDD4582919.1 pur operon repressor [Eubacteriales bacterium]
MKRTERVGALIRILSQHPNHTYSLGYFCQLFKAAKSTVSEDVSVAKQLLSTMELGQIETMAGAKGGIRFLPMVSIEKRKILLDNLSERLSDGSRILGGGFLYTSDLMFDADIAGGVAELFAEKFANMGADYVVTIETKGIPVAFMTAYMLNLPLVVVRRESKISEGSTVSINYFSGSSDRIQKMSLAKRAVEPGKKAIIIDDFMRAGGSIKGIIDILGEFDVKIVGTGVVIASMDPVKKKIQDYYPLLYLGKVDEETKRIEIFRNKGLFCNYTL